MRRKAETELGAGPPPIRVVPDGEPHEGWEVGFRRGAPGAGSHSASNDLLSWIWRMEPSTAAWAEQGRPPTQATTNVQLFIGFFL
jgi:hypothetical protein